MGRAGITITNVESALRQLRERGEKPSVRKVQKLVGGGSFTTIQRYMNELQTEALTPFGELGFVSQELANLVLQLDDRIKDLNETELAVERQKAWQAAETLRAQLAEHEQSLAAAAQREAELQKEVERLDRLSQTVTESLNKASAALNDRSQELLLANQMLEQRQQQISKAERVAEIAQANLEALQQASNEARVRDFNAYEAERTQLKAQLVALESQLRAEREQAHQARTDTAIAQERLAQVTSNHQRIAEQQEASIAQARNELKSMEIAQIELRAELRTVKERADDLSGRAAQLETDLRVCTEQRSRLAAQFEAEQSAHQKCLLELATVKAQAQE